MNVISRTIVFIYALLFSHSPFSLKELTQDADLYYYMFDPSETLPRPFVAVAKKMFFESYPPELHEGYTLELMGIDSRKYQSYEAFLHALIEQDFEGYVSPSERFLFFAMSAPVNDNFMNLVGLAAVLPESITSHYS